MRFFSFLIIPILLMSIVGCFGSGEVKIDKPPAFVDAKRIVVTKFIAEDTETQELGKRVSKNLAERLELVLKDNDWVYDVSEKVQPIDDKVAELGLTLNDIYADPALAAKVGQALEADIIITGMVQEPKIRRIDNNEHYMRQGRQTGISGTSTYITTRQSVSGTVRVKAVNVATGEMLYNNQILSYLKYWFAYQTQQSGQVIFKEDNEMLADLGLHLPRRISYELYPTGLKKEPEEKVLLTPEIVLKGTGGVFKYD